MKTLVVIVAILIGLPVLAAAAFFTIGPERIWALVAGNPDLGRYDFNTLKRRKTPNDALLCSPGLCAGASDGPLPVFDDSPEDVMKKINEKIASSGDLVRRVDDRTDPSYARYVTLTPLMRFPDTNDIEAVGMADGKTGLRAYARAQLGKGDGGVNRARLKRWLQRR